MFCNAMDSVPYLKTMDIEYPFLKMKLLVYDKTDVRPSPELILLGCMLKQSG